MCNNSVLLHIASPYLLVHRKASLNRTKLAGSGKMLRKPHKKMPSISFTWAGIKGPPRFCSQGTGRPWIVGVTPIQNNCCNDIWAQCKILFKHNMWAPAQRTGVWPWGEKTTKVRDPHSQILSWLEKEKIKKCTQQVPLPNSCLHHCISHDRLGPLLTYSSPLSMGLLVGPHSAGHVQAAWCPPWLPPFLYTTPTLFHPFYPLGLVEQ